VKTSILVLDKSLARQSDTIAFFKVENDGFGLGAQRRAFDKNDLPQVRAELETYLQGLRAGEFRAKGPASYQPGATPQENAPHNAKGLKARPKDGSGLQPSDSSVNREPGALPQAGMGCAVGAQFTCGLIVPKEKNAANGDYNLSGERYREGIVTMSAFPHALIRDVSEIITKGTTPTTIGYAFEDSGVNFIKIESVAEDGKIIASKVAHISSDAHAALARSQLAAGDVLFSIAGAMGRSAVVDPSLLPANTNQALAIIRVKQEVLSPFYLSHLLRSSRILAHVESVKAGVAQYNVSLQQVGDFQIPLPPLEVQKEILAEIEGYQNEIERLKTEIANQEKKHPKINSQSLGRGFRERQRRTAIPAWGNAPGNIVGKPMRAESPTHRHAPIALARHRPRHLQHEGTPPIPRP